MHESIRRAAASGRRKMSLDIPSYRTSGWPTIHSESARQHFRDMGVIRQVGSLRGSVSNWISGGFLDSCTHSERVLPLLLVLDLATPIWPQIIAGRAERAAGILTTNQPFSEWTQVIPNARLCNALIR